MNHNPLPSAHACYVLAGSYTLPVIYTAVLLPAAVPSPTRLHLLYRLLPRAFAALRQTCCFLSAAFCLSALAALPAGAIWATVVLRDAAQQAWTDCSTFLCSLAAEDSHGPSNVLQFCHVWLPLYHSAASAMLICSSRVVVSNLQSDKCGVGAAARGAAACVQALLKQAFWQR